MVKDKIIKYLPERLKKADLRNCRIDNLLMGKKLAFSSLFLRYSMHRQPKSVILRKPRSEKKSGMERAGVSFLQCVGFL